MHIQIHAKRFGETPEDRDQPYFNPGGATITLGLEIVVIRARDGVVYTTINGKPQMPLALGEYDFTAVAICYGDAPASS